MGPGGDQLSLSEATARCITAFNDCLQQTAPDVRATSLLETELARFSLWTSYLNVFVEGRASLDHRLREAPEVLQVVLGLLKALEHRVEDYNSQAQSFPKAGPLNFDGLRSATQKICGEIDLLYRLMNSIRKASKDLHNLKATESFQLRAVVDEKEIDIEPALKASFRRILQTYCRPDIGENLLNRLTWSMVARRKRVLYRRSRYARSPLRESRPVPKPVTTPPVPKDRIIPSETRGDTTGIETSSTATIPNQYVARSMAPTATTLHPEKYRKVSSPSTISRTRTIDLSNHESLMFPEPPNFRVIKRYKSYEKTRRQELADRLNALPDHTEQGLSQADKAETAEAELQEDLDIFWKSINHGSVEVICPICFYALPRATVLDAESWKRHVTDDLESYVCLFEDCDSYLELYSHSRDWLNHMEQHTLRWRCKANSHGTLIFHDRSEYESHMQTTHKQPPSKVQMLADMNSLKSNRMFSSCPICGSDNIEGVLEHHVIGHMRSIALKSLPAIYDEHDGENGKGEGDGTTASSLLGPRSTLNESLHSLEDWDEGAESPRRVYTMEGLDTSGEMDDVSMNQTADDIGIQSEVEAVKEVHIEPEESEKARDTRKRKAKDENLSHEISATHAKQQTDSPPKQLKTTDHERAAEDLNPKRINLQDPHPFGQYRDLPTIPYIHNESYQYREMPQIPFTESEKQFRSNVYQDGVELREHGDPTVMGPMERFLTDASPLSFDLAHANLGRSIPVFDDAGTSIPDYDVTITNADLEAGKQLSETAGDSDADYTPNKVPRVRPAITVGLKDRQNILPIVSSKTWHFPCPLRMYGCLSTFDNKSEWKIHVSTQHTKLGLWRCDLCSAPVDPYGNKLVYYNDYNRKDFFTQHLRRMHAAPVNTSRQSREYPVTEDNIDEHQRRCFQVIRNTPPQSACLFCDRTFTGPSSWDERLEHIGRHLEEFHERGIEPGDFAMWNVDKELEGWFWEEGIIARDQNGNWTIGDKRPRRHHIDDKSESTEEHHHVSFPPPSLGTQSSPFTTLPTAIPQPPSITSSYRRPSPYGPSTGPGPR